MPPTTALTFAANEAKIRWREPYVSEGLNRKFAGVIPRGIYRGFGIQPSGAALSIDILADASGVNLAVYETVTAYQLTLRKNATFAVSLAAFANTTVYIVLYATYVPTALTVAELRVYSVADYNAAIEKPELVVLGTVDVPIAALIPASAISFSEKTLPWKNVPAGAQPWQQVVRNGGFEEGAGTVVPGPGFQPIPGFSGEVVGSATCQVLDTDPRTGALSLWMGTSALASFSRLGPGSFDSTQPLSAGGTPVLAGQLVDVSFWVKCLAVVAYSAGTSGLRLILRFYSNADALIDTFTVASDPLVQVGTTAQYDQLSGIFAAPVDGYFTWYFAADIDLTTGVGVFKIDDVQISVEPPAVFTEISGADPVTLPTVRGTQLDIVPANSVSRLAQNNAAARLEAVTSGSDTVLSLSTAGDKSVLEVPGWDTPYVFNKIDDFGSSAVGMATNKTTADQDTVPNDYKLLYAFNTTSSGNRTPVRVYSRVTNGELVITHNAYWTGTQWASDFISFVGSMKFSFGAYGIRWEKKQPHGPTWTDNTWNTDAPKVEAGPGGSLLRLEFVTGLFDAVASSNLYGVAGLGDGTGHGVVGTGGTTSGRGVSGTGGAPDGNGVVGQGQGTGRGVQGTGGATSGYGVYGVGGATSGYGVYGVGGTPNGFGVFGEGVGTGDGVQGSALGDGNGVVGLASGTGDGVRGVAYGTGIGGAFTGSGVGSGVTGLGGATSGPGVTGTGGAPDGVGVVGTGTGTGDGVQGVAFGTGRGLRGLAVGTGTGVVGSSGSGDGGEFTGGGNGRGVLAVASGTGSGVTASRSAGVGSCFLGLNDGSGYGAQLGGNATRAPLALGGLAAAPSSTSNGDVYYDTGTAKLRVRAGGIWVDLH